MTTHTANETNLDIELNDFLGSPITIKCEVEILKDNGYGRLSTDTETKEVFFISPLHSTPIALITNYLIPETFCCSGYP